MFHLLICGVGLAMTSKTTVLAVVIALAVFSVLGLAGGVALILANKGVPDPLWTLVGVAVGALGSLLASTRSTLGPNDTEPTPTVPAPSATGSAPLAGKLPQ